MEEYRRILNKQAAAGKLEELYRTLKSDRFINQELKEFYHNFDVSFLKIFPNFVEEFNRLLPVEEQLHPKNACYRTAHICTDSFRYYRQCAYCRIFALFHNYHLYLSFQAKKQVSL